MTPREIADKAWAIYRDRLKALLEPSEAGRFVAIDVESGEHFIGDSAGEAALKANGKATRRLFCIRIGFPSTFSIRVLSHT